jgi:hypothetical protein
MKIIVRLSSRASGLRGIGQSPSERAERVDQRTLHRYFGATRMSMSAVGLSWKGSARKGESGGDEDSRNDNPGCDADRSSPGVAGGMPSSIRSQLTAGFISRPMKKMAPEAALAPDGTISVGTPPVGRRRP